MALLCMAFNQDFDCAVFGLSTGFAILSLDPLRLACRRDFADGGIGYAEMLFRCNYLALVGGSARPKYPNHIAVVWDEGQQTEVFDITLKAPVKAVKLRRDRFVVVLENRAYVYTLTKAPKRILAFETCENAKGLVALSVHETNSVLVLPGREHGQIQIVDLREANPIPFIVIAHETSLSCLALSRDGTKLATASEKGTLVRIFDTSSGLQLRELRRGTDKATILSLNFNNDATLLCVASDKLTVHVFKIDESSEPPPAFSLGKDSLLPKYFSSQWSFAKFKVSGPCVCAFTPSASGPLVTALCADGFMYRYRVDDVGGEGVAQRTNFLQMLYEPVSTDFHLTADPIQDAQPTTAPPPTAITAPTPATTAITATPTGTTTAATAATTTQARRLSTTPLSPE
eukprot:m.72940 g.72940  ORF g.72940 m.72940 type:complete len:401 (+) comp50264_c0_seq1:91-1293(+)